MDPLIAQNDSAFLRALINALPGLVFVLDPDRRFVLWNDNFERASGYDAEEMRRISPLDLVAEDEREYGSTKLEELFANDNMSIEVTFTSKQGVNTPYLFSGKRAIFDGRVYGMGLGIDISDRKRIEAELNAERAQVDRLALYDGLTNLANRNLLLQVLGDTLQHSYHHASSGLILFLDIDRFKAINDSLGHHRGDKLLQLVSERLRGAIDDGDTIARHGGDEFIAIMPGSSIENAPSIAKRILAAFKEPFLVVPHELHVTCSIGICSYPQDGIDASMLIRNADTAMYAAKAAGRNTFRQFTQEMSTRANLELSRANDLHRAIANSEFELHYQPMVDIASGALLGCEALVRWNHPSEGLIMPGEFIALAEDIGLVEEIGNFVFEQACRQLRAWHDEGLDGLIVAVNVSVRQLRDAAFISHARDCLHRYAIDPENVEIEITESIFISDDQRVAATLAALGNLGLRIAIDDFGVGYSSLGYLRRLNPSKVKIDRSFVRDMLVDHGAAAIVKAVVALGRVFGFAVLAEGVETPEELDAARRIGCDEAQGYLFSRPKPAAELSLDRPFRIGPVTNRAD